MGKKMNPGKAGGKKHSKSSGSSSSIMSKTGTSTGIDAAENEYLLQVLDLKETCADWENLFSRSIQEDRRMLQWQHASMMGEPLLQKYAWAVPCNAAIKLLAKFSPVVEIGAGKGYWAHLVQQQGGYVLPFDIKVPKKSEAWTKVFEGTPQSILTPAVAQNKQAPLSALNLFLCYPDQGQEVGLPSLEAFQTLTDEYNNHGQGPVQRLSKSKSKSKEIQGGEEIGGGYIVHVGELLTTGCISGAPQAPWGRTSSPDFQERLFKDYHCVLTMPLESFPFSRDFLTVWKRTVMFDAKDMEFEDDSDDEGLSEKEEEEEDEGERRGEEESVQQRKRRKVTSMHEDQDENNEEDIDEEEERGEEENDDEWADIPAEERLPHLATTTAAPCMQRFLRGLNL